MNTLDTLLLLHRDTRAVHVPFSKIRSPENYEWVFNEPDCIVCQKHNCGTPDYISAKNYMKQRDALQYNSESGDLYFLHNANRDTYSGLISYAYYVTGAAVIQANFSITREVYLNVTRFYILYSTETSIPYDVLSLFGDFNNCTHESDVDILRAVTYTDTGFRCEIPVPFTLFIYQHENIRWMLSAEASKQVTYAQPRIFNIPHPSGKPEKSVYISTDHKRVYSHATYSAHYTKTVRFPGGCLFDDVGLGKTACVILVSIQNPPKYRASIYAQGLRDLYGNDTLSGLCTKVLKTGEKCNNTVSNNTQIFCHRHIPRNVDTSEFTADTASFIVKKGRKDRSGAPVFLLQSKATIIFVPNQVTTQWEEAIKTIPGGTGTRNGLIVIALTTKTQFDTTTYLQLLTADFVIVSHNFLTNDAFIQSIRRYTSTDTADFQEALLNVSYNNVYSDPHFLWGVSPFIGCIRWHRMVIDEVHEIPDSDFLCGMYSKYRWCLSGTPGSVLSKGVPKRGRLTIEDDLPVGSSVVSAKGVSQKVLSSISSPRGLSTSISSPKGLSSVSSPRGLSSIDYILKYIVGPRYTYEYSDSLTSVIIQNVIRRNTDLSTAHEKQIPPITEKVFIIELSRVERGLYSEYAQHNRYSPRMLEYPDTTGGRYKNANTIIEHLRELCSHPYMHAGFESAESLADVSDMLINNYNKRILALETLISTKTIVCDQLLADVSNVSSAGDAGRYLQDRVTSVITEITTAETELNTARRNLSYYKASCKDALESPDSECPICFVPYAGSVIGVADCGHSYCHDCILKISKSSGGGPCALCRQPIRTIRRLDNTVPKTVPKYQCPPEYNRMQNQYGTKIANVIMCIQHTIKTGERIIVFSQWTRLLKKLEDILRTEGIRSVSCRGNVSGKNNALRIFQSDPSIPVICLSSNNAASGSNLMSASVIIFLESLFADSRAKCIEMEEQANGRARRLGQKLPVKVYRFIAKDTLELPLLELYSPPDPENIVDCSQEKPEYL